MGLFKRDAEKRLQARVKKARKKAERQDRRDERPKRNERPKTTTDRPSKVGGGGLLQVLGIQRGPTRQQLADLEAQKRARADQKRRESAARQGRERKAKEEAERKRRERTRASEEVTLSRALDFVEKKERSESTEKFLGGLNLGGKLEELIDDVEVDFDDGGIRVSLGDDAPPSNADQGDESEEPDEVEWYEDEENLPYLVGGAVAVVGTVIGGIALAVS